MKKISKKFKIIFSILVIGIILPIFIVCAFFRPTTLNKYITSKLYNDPVNSYFKDQNFYNCVIDAYNDLNSTSYDSSYNLSDEELSSITWLNCDGVKLNDDKKITDMTGLDKLTGLIYLNVGSNLITELDISNNTTLTFLDVSDNLLTKLDVTKNTMLSSLIANNNKLSLINVDQNVLLESLSIYNNELTELDVSKNTALKLLYIYNNELTKLDVSKNKELTWLDVNENKLTNLDISKNTNLTNLNVSDNNLTSLDLSNNTLLQEASIDINMTKFLYKGTTEVLDIPVNFWSNIVTMYKQSAPVNENIVIENNNVNAKKTGKYNLILNYETTISDNISGVVLIPNITIDVNSIFNVIELKSDKYIIDEENNKIYYGDSFSKDDIKIMLGDEEYTADDLSLEYTDNKLMVKYNDKEIRTFNVYKLSITSDKYIIDEENSIIYYNDSFSKDDIKVMLGDEEYTDELLTLDTYITTLTEEQLKNADMNDDGVVDEKDAELILKYLSGNDIGITIENTSKGDVDANGKVEPWDATVLLRYLNKYTILSIKYNDTEIVSYVVKQIKLTSSTYLNIDNGYVYVGTDDIDLGKITTNIGSLNINTDLNNLEVVHNDKVYKSIPIIKTNYSNYVVKDDNIYTFNEELDLSKLSSTNSEFKIDKDSLKLIYNENIILKTYNIKKILITSDEYFIDDNNIYVKGELSIDKINVENATTNINNDKLEILIGDEVLKTYNIVKYTIKSDVYEIIDNYICSYNNSINKDYIITSYGEVSIADNTVNITYNEEIIDSYKFIHLTSDKYRIGSDYIYTGTYTFNIEDITSNGVLSLNDEKLELKDNDKLLKTFDIVNINLGSLKINNKVITINNEMSYDDFTSNITVNGVTYKIEKDVTISADDPKYEEITSGNITGGLLLRIYKGSEIVSYYSINQGYYKITNTDVKVDEINKYISGIKDNQTVEIIKTIVEHTGTVTIIDKDNNEKDDSSIVGTGDKIKIDLGNNRIFTYTLIVKGDVDGDGEVSAADAFKIIRHSLEIELLENEYFLAGDIDSDDDLTTADAFKIIRYNLELETNL